MGKHRAEYAKISTISGLSIETLRIIAALMGLPMPATTAALEAMYSAVYFRYLRNAAFGAEKPISLDEVANHLVHDKINNTLLAAILTHYLKKRKVLKFLDNIVGPGLREYSEQGLPLIVMTYSWLYYLQRHIMHNPQRTLAAQWTVFAIGCYLSVLVYRKHSRLNTEHYQAIEALRARINKMLRTTSSDQVDDKSGNQAVSPDRPSGSSRLPVDEKPQQKEQNQKKGRGNRSRGKVHKPRGADAATKAAHGRGEREATQSRRIKDT